MLIVVFIKDKKGTMFTGGMYLPIARGKYPDFQGPYALKSEKNKVLMVKGRLVKEVDFRGHKYFRFECVTRDSKGIPKIRFSFVFPDRAVGNIGAVNGQNFDNGRFNKATLTINIPH